MCLSTVPSSGLRSSDETASIPPGLSAGEELVALGWEVNANQYRLVHLAARYDDELEWFHRGLKSAACWISAELGIHSSTAREWIRVGHALRYLPAIDAAFAGQELSYAKVRILTRWADPDNEAQLLALARDRSADRLTTAIAKALAEGDETDAERDARLHESRSLTSWTDGDGMTIIRIAVPPDIGKPIMAAVDELVTRIAATPPDSVADAPADASRRPSVVAAATQRDQDAPADASDQHSVTSNPTQGDQGAPADALGQRSVAADPTQGDRHSPADASDQQSGVGGPTHREERVPGLPQTLGELRRRWQPSEADDWHIPTLAQQRADAFAALFLGMNINLTTEIVIHVRGDGITFDDGTPTTTSAVLRHLDDAFIRLMIHDTDRRPINASHRRRHPTTAQRRVVLETHDHECVDCQSTDLLELDHNPPFHQTRHTITGELEPRCAPCHRARHRHDQPPPQQAAA